MQLYYSDQLVCKIEFLNIIYITRSNGIYVVHSESRMVTPSTIFDQSVTDLCFVWFGFVPVVWLKGLVLGPGFGFRVWLKGLVLGLGFFFLGLGSGFRVRFRARVWL